ncbi:hypothetical protein O7635_20890 [Asanoa sp. WMMD1127]|uniref:hypothetical protein n=1 Tax=Asanoa sp. WMMD1127 TaxID=3016107 RepID=UPI002417B54C|nr:hypothetical protein [Asanoa sp. WMMD1127]MDG4824315.1 hypothetical protein [Asanoa sp. WMMD1127]
MTEFTAQLLGRTEKALNAILERELAGIGIDEPQWVALTLTVTGGPAAPDAAARRVAEALKVPVAEGRRRLDELVAAGLVRLDETVAATDEGVARWHRVRAAIGPIQQRLWGDLPAADLDAAGRVLDTVLGRANTLLV